MSGNEVRQSDIDDLRTEYRDLFRKLDEIQKEVSRILPPLAEMAIQVSHNQAAIKKSEEDVKEDICQLVKSQQRWETRVWTIVGIVILQLIGLIMIFVKGVFNV